MLIQKYCSIFFASGALNSVFHHIQLTLDFARLSSCYDPFFQASWLEIETERLFHILFYLLELYWERYGFPHHTIIVLNWIYSYMFMFYKNPIVCQILYLNSHYSSETFKQFTFFYIFLSYAYSSTIPKPNVTYIPCNWLNKW